MEKLRMHTPDMAEENYKKLAALFPNAVTETIDDDGNVVRAIDKDVLMQEINTKVVDDGQERYQFTWPDKRKAIILANQPIAKTLRFVKEKSVGRDGTPGGTDSENIYIEGDNLDALKILRETYLGKVKMIYIDPPYNTGNDFIYEDDFSQSMEEYAQNSGQRDEEGNRLVQNSESNGRFHTDWLNMMYPRLMLAKDIIKDDGFIALSIGEEESHNLRKICNEIFGETNFRNIIAVRRYDKNLNLQFVDEGLSTMNVGLEYILVYSKNRDSKMKAVYKDATDDRGKKGYWKGFWNNADRPTMRYDILGVLPVEGQWKWRKEIAEEAVKNYQEYEKYANKITLEEYWLKTGKNKKFIRRNLKGTGKNLGVEHWVAPTDGILRNSNWSDYLISRPVGMEIPFDSPKNPDVILELMSLFNVTAHDIVMDFFSGSATTAESVMHKNIDNNNRKYIMVQIPELCGKKRIANRSGFKTICDIGEERIRRAGKKIKEKTSADIDYGFRCFKVDSSNMEDVYYKPSEVKQAEIDLFADNIKADRTPEDLLIQVMLDLGVLLSSKVEKTQIAGKHVFSVADGYLIACFDDEVTEEVVTAIAKKKPFYAVFRDSSMADDSVAANFEQIFATYSPQTVRKVL
jgi:adenine-specific DNA-methyltransferase